ncbi:MAG: transcriptional regulator, TetR family [Frankiales bacterium]|nr:transcriptional regulator, TetR family [Frankiales bacterium]
MTTAAPRRELLLEAAADLFAARGFHAVGIDDIGAAAGITGPGVYRHFPSKQALLESLCDRTMDRMLGLVEGTSELATLVDLHVELVVSERALIGVWVREQRALAEQVRRSLRVRMRRYEQLWRDALAPHRSDLDAAQLALTVGAALAMLNTTALIDSPLPAPERAALLRRQALAALLAA